MKKLALIVGLLLAALAMACLIVFGHGDSRPPSAPTDLPWQIDSLPSGGTRVFGLNLTEQAGVASTLADVQRHWPSDFQMAVIAAPGEDGALEAYVESASMGFIAGKLVVTAHVNPDVIRGFRERAAKAEFMDSSTRKYRLSEADALTALQSPILALAFIPQAHLDGDIVKARFGEPAERLRSNEHVDHWLYPAKGLGITLDSQGKDLLQYVVPAQFARLRDPLLASKPH
jgi:hypothetical protein